MTIATEVQDQPLPIDLPFRLISGTIGSGAYAFIRKASPKTAPTPVIAIKFINKEYAYRVGRVKPKNLNAEVSLHNHVGQHNNIIQFLSCGEDARWTWIAMELATGDLFDKIEADTGVGEDIAHFYFSQLISAVGYMHSKHVAHRDIKPENILLADGDLKLADFGLAVLFQHNGARKPCVTVCGSPPYMAPEVVPKEGFTGRRTKPYEGDLADIWSCGIVLFVLLVGNTPWDEPTRNSYEYNDYVENGATDELWLRIPHQAISLVRGMLRPDPTSRMTMEDVRRHPWFTRPNPYLASDGRVANPVGLATQMLESLHINFEADSISALRRQSRRPADPDAMDIDVSGRLALTQPEIPLVDMHFDWERTNIGANSDRLSASQPLAALYRAGPSSAAERFTQDPSQSQFSAMPTVPLSVTQFARKFHDVMPDYSLARFLSFMDFNLLLPLLCEALERLGIMTPRPQRFNGDGVGAKALIQVRTRDQRNCLLAGKVQVERIEEDVLEVRFLKMGGDPLEWRRLFKKVAVLCKDAILRPEE